MNIFRVTIRYFSGPLCGAETHQRWAASEAAATAEARLRFAYANPTVTVRSVTAERINIPEGYTP